MLRCIAIDDEPLALELLVDNISKVPNLDLIGAFNSPLDAMKLMQEQKVDLVFLDIQMPGLTGLQFIKSIAQKPMFILITAYEKYALEGYNLDVVDYLLKPVALDRFIKACNKAAELFQLKTRQPANPASYFFINVDYSLLKIVYADILWVEGLKDYIKIHLKQSEKPVVARMSIKAMEEQLPPGEFVRVQKSYIVSVAHITSIKKNSVFIGGHEIPVGDNFKEALDRLTRKSREA